jgi:hypothetical protein
VICSREARGFGYCHLLKWARFPLYHFCSRLCLDIGAAIAKENFGMIDKTTRERAAIKATRKSLAETLTKLGLMKPFFDRSADDIDAIIEACVDGYQASLQTQARQLSKEFDDDIPF